LQTTLALPAARSAEIVFVEGARADRMRYRGTAGATPFRLQWYRWAGRGNRLPLPGHQHRRL